MNETNLFDISAEYLLNYLYPDNTNDWKVDCAGTFYRNYRPDVLSINENDHTVQLSRDSFLRLLPQGIIAMDDALKGPDFEQKYEKLKKREELLRELFKPIDTLAFRFRLHIEKQAAQLTHDKLELILKQYFDYDWTKEENPYIKKTAPLLLFISRLRANFGFIRNLLALLFECNVEMKTGKYSWSERSQCSRPYVEYQLIIPELTSDTYNSMNKIINPFREFICEWFIPFDTHCIIAIKYHDQSFVLGDNLTLDYNTEIITDSSTQNIDS